jgi:hypothetical protein
MQFISSQMFSSPWPLVAAALGLLGLIALAASLAALVRLRLLPFTLRFAVGALLLALGAAVGTVAVGTLGYRALTHEATAAVIRVQPVAPQRFTATVQFPDDRSETFELAGDEIYVDAHILKWKPVANLLGLHTAYELDRIAGRYHAVSDEKALPRTVYALGAEKPLDLFSLRKRYVFLEPLLDAEYGSASFVPVNKPANLEVRISGSGVLIRERTP